MKNVLAVLALSAFMGAIFSVAHADPRVPPFYVAASKIKPSGKLGQIIKKEKVAT